MAGRKPPKKPGNKDKTEDNLKEKAKGVTNKDLESALDAKGNQEITFNDLLVNSPVPLLHGLKRSNLLDELDPQKELIALAAKTRFREITVGKGASASKYEAFSNTLVLSPEDALAVAAFSHAVPNASPSAEILKSYIAMSAFPANATPEQIAATLFFAHLCTNGITQAADNLYISTKTVALLRENNMLERLEEIR